MKYQNKVALITGGKRMGMTIAEDLAKRGCNIVLTYRQSIREAKQTAKIIKHYNRKSLLVKTDMTQKRSVSQLIKKIKTHFNRLDFLINMASVYAPTPVSKLSEKDWNQNIDANLKSAFISTMEAKFLLKKSRGRVINFSDWVSQSGRPRYKSFIPYYTAKKGVIGLTEAMALELAPEVLVNSIAPGPILPPKKIFNEETKSIQNVTPLGRWGGPIEISKAVLFLIDTDFVTGETIRVDGGRHLY